MKRPSSPVLGSSAPDPTQYEETPGNLPTQLPEVAPLYSQQDFAQLIARYKQAGYEAIERWDQARRVAG